MAEQNPIRYQDLIAPDDSIEKLILQLSQLNEAYTGMADSVKSQASQVAASLRSVSGATEQGRNATRNASQEADRLAKAYKDLEFAQSNTAKRIQELKQLKNEEARMTKLQIQLNRSAEGSYNQLSAQYSLNKMAINNLTKAERENDPAAKKLIEDTKAIYEEMKRMQEATGKFQLNVGNYENAITNAIGVNTRWYQNIQQLGQLFEGGFSQSVKAAGAAIGNLGKQFLALLANPIVATIAAVTAAFMALAKGISSSEENTNKLSQVLAPFERILTGVVNILQKMAGFILDVVAGMEQMVMWCSKQLESLPLVGKAIQSVNRALEENIELKKQQAWLDKAERTKNEANAKLARDVARLKNLAAQTNDNAEKQRILNLAKQGEMKIMKNELALAQRDLAIKEAKAKQAGNDKKTNDELAAARVRLYRAEEQYYTGTMRLERQLNTLRNKEEKGGGGGKIGKVDTSAVDEQKKLLEEERKIEDARIAIIDDAYVRERMTIITNYNRKIEDAKKQYGEETELAVLYETEKEQKLAELFEKEAKDAQAQEKKKQELLLKETQEGERQREAAIREAEKEIEQAYDFDMSVAELEKNENKKTDMRLQAEKKRLQALLALYQKDGKTLTDVEVQTIQNAIEAVDQEIENNKKNKDIWDLLGFSLSDEAKQHIATNVQYAVDSLQTFMDAYKKAAEEKRKLADEAVENTKSVLDAEIEARNAGYANEVETARKEYEAAKKQQEKAIQDQRKAQRAQEAIDTATQVSSLITATANIWKAHSSIPYVGTALAIAATALMWGAFAASKIKAHEVAGSSTESYGEGTVQLLEGGSHQSGNDIDLGRKPDGTRRRAEGGEFFAVINKRNSRKFRDVIPNVIHSLNDGTFADKYMNAYDGGAMAIVPSGTNLTRVEEGIDRINGNLEKPHTYTDGRGNTIIMYKNLKRKINGN